MIYCNRDQFKSCWDDPRPGNYSYVWIEMDTSSVKTHSALSIYHNLTFSQTHTTIKVVLIYIRWLCCSCTCTLLLLMSVLLLFILFCCSVSFLYILFAVQLFQLFSKADTTYQNEHTLKELYSVVSKFSAVRTWVVVKNIVINRY